MYLQHYGLQQNTDGAKNILFYALWGLYALTTTTFILDMVQFCWIDVSMDYHRCLASLQLVLQNVKLEYHLQIIQSIIFASCDVIAQSILVRTTGNNYHYSSNSRKIYRCWIVWGCNIRVVIIPSFLAFVFLGTLIIFIHLPILINGF